MTWLRIYCCGFAMGVVELIPGFSGGTVAFITGIYQRLVKALGAFNLAWLKSLMQLVRGRAQRQQVLGPIDAGFLLVLVLGMFTAWLLTARLIQWLLITHKLLLWAGLFGLVFGVILTMIARHKQQRTAVSWLLGGEWVWAGPAFDQRATAASAGEYLVGRSDGGHRLLRLDTARPFR